MIDVGIEMRLLMSAWIPPGLPVSTDRIGFTTASNNGSSVTLWFSGAQSATASIVTTRSFRTRARIVVGAISCESSCRMDRRVSALWLNMARATAPRSRQGCVPARIRAVILLLRTLSRIEGGCAGRTDADRAGAAAGTAAG